MGDTQDRDYIRWEPRALLNPLLGRSDQQHISPPAWSSCSKTWDGGQRRESYRTPAILDAEEGVICGRRVSCGSLASDQLTDF